MQSLHRFLLIVVMASQSACSSDSDGLTEPGDEDDTTAPTVVSTSPADLAVDVAVGAVLQVVFSEDMRPTTWITGIETTEGRKLLGTNWLNARTLEIEHEDWNEASVIDITLNGSLTDLSGNQLARYNWTFDVETTVPFLESSLPSDLATNIGTNARLFLNFSTPMNLDALGASITVVDDANPSVLLPVEVNVFSSMGKQVRLDLPGLLPEDATITVNVDTSAESLAGMALASSTSFSFTTGSGVDGTPPSLPEIVPASGSAISANTPSITFTFDEIIDAESLHIIFYSAQFLSLFGGEDVPGEWSLDGKVLTVPLPAPLPAGIPLVLTIYNYSDLTGNQQQTPIEYRVDVAGDGDGWPFVDGARYQYRESWEESEPGGPVFGDETQTYYQVNYQGGTTYHWAEYSDASYSNSRDTIFFSVTPAAIAQIGERYYEDNQAETVTLTPGVEWARMPFDVSTWEQTGTVALPEGTAEFNATISVLGVEDVPSLIDDLIENVWLDCWQVIRSWELTIGSEVLETGTATFWYAPSIGVVKSVTSVDQQGGFENSTEELLSWQRP